VTGTATNCGTSAAHLLVRLGDGAEVDLGEVAGNGGTAPISLPAGNLSCPAGGSFTVTARADVPGEVDCPGTGDTKTVTVACLNPDIEVTKTGQSQVNNGATISYTITVTNASTTTDLEDIVVRDVLCTYVKDPRNYGGNCTGGVPVYNPGDRSLTWPEFDLARNTSCTITFDVTADIIGGGGTCPSTVQCLNRVHVYGFCAGSGGTSRDDDDAEWPTSITCVGENCPRTVGFWGAQCSGRDNGSKKFSDANLLLIAQCISDESDFFEWPDADAFVRFCRIINPSIMNQRVQAKRQFAGLLANLCTDKLNLQPIRGGTIFLDPTTPISCSGLEADTIAELIDEVDALLAALEGQELNDPVVKAKYSAIIGCLDAINNGRIIPTTPDCEHGATTSGSEVGASDEPTDETDASVELYRPSPNPFSGSTSFAYSVSGSEDAAVDITVFDVAGRQIRKLVSGTEKAGVHIVTWDGTSDGGTRVNRGVYFVRTVIAGRKEATNRILYLTEAR
jgi:uncharacterized repeat protein (TIGR01451 family)